MKLALYRPFSPDTFETRPLFRFYHVTEHLYLFSLAAHLFLLTLFAAFGVTPMVWYNCASIAAFILCLRLNRTRRHLLAFAIGSVEVLLHAFLAAWFVGISAGFHLIILTLGPCMFLLPFPGYSAKWLLMTFSIALFLAVHYSLADHAVAYRMVVGGGETFFIANIVIMTLSLSLLTYYLSRASWAAEDYITYLTQIDPLTGILNRRGIESALNTLGRSSGPTGDATAILMCDIDDFKQINDSRGHDVGDRVLTRAVAKMKNALRSSDRLGRWGGEEFLVLLPGTGLDGARTAGAKILGAVSSAEPGDALPNEPVSMTIGATVLRPGEGIAECIKRADAALYRGKLAGKNRVVADG